jgi:hypothetical protein
MIEQYEKTAFSDFFNYNDPLINQWAENVYEKIRQLGELAGYVVRDKEVRERFDVIDDTLRVPIMVKDKDFTFGYAYCGDLLQIVDDRIENAGRVHQIEIEIKFNEIDFADVNMFDDFVVISNTSVITIGGVAFSNFTLIKDHLYKIKIVRENISVSLYIDDVLTDSKLLSTNEDMTFNVLYSSINIDPVTMSPDYNLDYNTDYLSLNL